MMKKLIYSIIILSIFTQCDNILDKAPLDEISAETFWGSEDDFKLAANNLYTYLDMDAYQDVWSADYFTLGTDPVSSGNYVVSNTDGIWNSSYQGIRRANEIIENAAIAEVNSDVRTRYEAEAKLFRAYLYFKLVKRFGDVPLILKTLDFSSPELTGSRTERSLVYDQIIADLQFAAENLPKKSELLPDNMGRVTRGAALALLSRVGLFEGTHAKYHGHGDPNHYLNIAVDAATDFINDNEYPLIDDFTRLVSEDNENHSEIVLVKWLKEGFTEGSDFGRRMVVDAQMHPSKYLADAFLSADGLPIEHSPLFEGYNTITSEFQNRDPRMKYTIWEPLTEHEPGTLLIPDLQRSGTGYWPNKPGDPKALVERFVFTDHILLRSAEVLLNYAEAVYELNGAITDEELDFSINKLRARVGMPALTNDFVNGTNPADVTLDMLEEIRRERRIELAGEGFRYYDLIRWKSAEDDLTKPILGTKFQQDIYPGLVPGEDINVDENGFILAQSQESRSFEAPKNYIFPIPLGQLALNPSLTQNLGW